MRILMKMNKIKVSLNRECPCNSGEKYKKCCMGKISEEQEEYFGYLQYFDKIKTKLIGWFFIELEDEEKDFYAKQFGVKNAEVIAKKENPAEFFEWLFYQARDRKTNESILKTIIESYAYFFEPDELLVLRERIKNSQAGAFEILSSDEKLWKIKLKELITGQIYEVMDRLGSLDIAIGDILLTRIENIFFKDYLCGFGLKVPRRHLDQLILFIKDKYELKKKEIPDLGYEDFINLNLKEIMSFKSQPVKFIANDGEELKICDGKFRIDENNLDKLMDYFYKNKDFEIIEADYKTRTANIILKRKSKNVDREENTQMLTSFAVSPDGERIEYSGSIDIKKDKIKIFSQSEKSYKSLIQIINNIVSKKLILISEIIETAEESLKNSNRDDKSDTNDNIDPDNKLAEMFLTDYYKKWCDEKIPALNNKTPREVIKTEDGKKLLKELLIEFKNIDEHKRKSGEMDFSAEKIIRNELKFYD
jgi:hypothetical protein